jgi:Transposase DDE domain
MAFNEVLQRFVTEAPWCVMARGLLESAFAPRKMDALFDANAQAQETRTLLFSSCVEIMSWVVCRVRRSVNAACKHLRKHDALPVSVDAVYDKLARVETQTSAALVRYTAQEVNIVLEQLQAKPLTLLPGYDLRIVDGNHPEGTEHRLGILRDQGGGALPGVVVAVLNPQNRLVEDVALSEDGHAQECVLFDALLQRLRERQLWLADRHYCTSAILFGIARRPAFFLIRQHAGHLRWRLVGERRYCGRSDTGEVYEQTAILTDPETGKEMIVRRITVELDKPTRDGEKELHLLSNVPEKDNVEASLPGVTALTLAKLYLERWQLETAFKTLTVHLRCEPNTLGYPPAALFAFCVAIACYNLVGAMLGAVRAVHGEEEEKKVSSHEVADELAGTYRGMVIAVPDADWDVFRGADAVTLARLLKEIVTPMRVAYYHKYPSRPKKVPKKPRESAPRKHVSTHRLLNPHLYKKKVDP